MQNTSAFSVSGYINNVVEKYIFFVFFPCSSFQELSVNIAHHMNKYGVIISLLVGEHMQLCL